MTVLNQVQLKQTRIEQAKDNLLYARKGYCKALNKLADASTPEAEVLARWNVKLTSIICSNLEEEIAKS